MKITIDLSARDLQIIAAYTEVGEPVNAMRAKAYVLAAVQSCLDQDACYLRAKTDRERIRNRIARTAARVEPPRSGEAESS